MSVFKGVVRDKETGKLKLIQINDQLKVSCTKTGFLKEKLSQVKEIRGKHFVHYIRKAIIDSDAVDCKETSDTEIEVFERN